MRILIAGGTGFLGSEIVKKLSDDGHQIGILGRSKLQGEVEHWIGDIAQPETYQQLISRWKPEVVIQAAWVTDQLSYRESALNRGYAQNTLNFAEFCFQSEVLHFIGLGTSAEYGRPSEPCNASKSPGLPLDLYGAEKLWTLERIQKSSINFETRFSWARVFQPYGQNQDPNRLIPAAVRKFRAGETFSIQSPKNVLDWITSRDVAGGISYIINHDLPEVLDIGTSVGTSVGTVLIEVARQCGFRESYVESSFIEDSLEAPLMLVVDQKSPLLAHGWTPHDDLQSGISWALSL